MAKSGRFYKTIQELFKDLNRYSLAQFENEVEFWEKVNKDNNPFFKSLVALIREKLRPALDNGSVALIRIGKNTGAQNMTLRKPGLPKIEIRSQNKEPYNSENPTTVFGAKEDVRYDPFGWALLECNPLKESYSLKP